MHFDCVLSKTVSGGQEQPERQRDMQSGVGSLQVGGQAETQALNTSPSLSHSGAAGGEGIGKVRWE